MTKNYNKLDEFAKYVDDELFKGEELSGEEAIRHYTWLCSGIANAVGDPSPLLLTPVRLLVHHLEAVGRYEQALEESTRYKKLLARYLYLDDIITLSADLLISRLLRQNGDSDKWKTLSIDTWNRIQEIAQPR